MNAPKSAAVFRAPVVSQIPADLRAKAAGTEAHATASELAGLPGLPQTAKGVRAWARKVKLPSAPRLSGRGGGEAYAIEALPLDAQRALAERRAAKTAMVRATEEDHRQVDIAAAAAPTRGLKGWQREVLDARLAILADIDRRAVTLGIVRARNEFLEERLGGLMDATLAAMVAKAAHGGELSARTLERWHGMRRDGIVKLAPASRERETAPAWAEALLRLYRRPQKPSLAQCLEMLPAALPENVAMPKYGAAKRFIRALPKVEAMRGRMGPRELKSIRPFVVRDFANLTPNDVWLADGHTADFDVAHPVHGRPFRPEITTVIDAATRRVVGWSAALKESTWSVADALRGAVETNGIPAMFYSDRGPGYINAVLDDKTLGVLARLGVQAEKSLPYNSQARGIIERAHKTIWVRAGKLLTSFRGQDMDREARMLVERQTRDEIAETGGSRHLMRWPDFVKWATAQVEAYNNRPHSTLEEAVDFATGAKRNRTPFEAWTAFERGGWVATRCEAEILADLFRPVQEAKCTRGEVRLFGNRYAHAALEAYHGTSVLVGYDIHDATKVWVRDKDERLICVARLDGNLRAYFPQTVVERARVQRAKRREGTLSKRLLEIRDELGAPAIDAQPVPLAVDDETEEAAAAMLEKLEGPRRAEPAALEGDDIAGDRIVRPNFEDDFDYADWLIANRDRMTAQDRNWLIERLAAADFQIGMGIEARDAERFAAELAAERQAQQETGAAKRPA